MKAHRFPLDAVRRRSQASRRPGLTAGTVALLLMTAQSTRAAPEVPAWHAAQRTGANLPTASAPDSEAYSQSNSAAVPASRPVPATIRWTPTPVVEGTLFSIIVEGGEPRVHAAAGTFGGQPLHFEPREDGALVALAAAALDSVGARSLRVELTLVDGAPDARVLEIAVERGTYAMQRLTVAPEFGQPQPPEIQRRIDAESARAFEVSRSSHTTPRMWEPPFVAPRESRITSGFGHGRMFNAQVQSRHTGTDFAGAVGAPVLAPARGVVALVDDFYLGGGVIYLDHGAGLVTGYLHLSDQLVSPGDVVERGQTIGRVGATGRVTGPHLHWIVRYGPHSVDGLSLLSYRR